ncbi:MAG: hypothetical protein K2H50_09740, partial [Paramuribaculum sp.]|nr:hypothetical protein [Paramuribaculum sp.]
MTQEEIDYLRALKEKARKSESTRFGSSGNVVASLAVNKSGRSKGLPEYYLPSESELNKYLDLWDKLGDYVAHEKALSMIFREDSTFRQNTDLRHIIIKCSALNDFYATNIYRIAPVAGKIYNIPDFDERLAKGDDM